MGQNAGGNRRVVRDKPSQAGLEAFFIGRSNRQVVADAERKGIDMTTGAIGPKITSLAWPLVLGNLLQTAYNLADMFWVGRVSGEAVAAVSLMFPLSWMFVSTAIGITAATIALVSQHVGAGERRKADRVVGQTVLLALALSAVLGAGGWLVRHEILTAMGAEGLVFTDALAYIEIIFFSLPFTFLFFAFRAALQGAGDTKTAMWLVFVSAGLNVIIDPFLILGWGPFVPMGTRGAAWATLASRGFATAVGIAILLRGGYGVRLHLADLRPDRREIERLVKIGYPATLDGWARSSAAVVMASFVTPFGTAAIAAYGVGVRLMSVTWSVAGAVGQATATGVGQNLGAKTPDRARRVTWIATGGTMAFLGAAAVVGLVFPEPLYRIFIDDPAIVAEGKTFMYVIAPVWAFFGGTMVIQGAFRGAGQTGVAMGLSLLSRWVFRVPVALGVAFSATVALPGFTIAPTIGLGIGVVGVWIGYAFGGLAAFIVAVLWFRRGNWTEGVLEDDEPSVPDVAPDAPE
jgi:putative MATE family efflux protein